MPKKPILPAPFHVGSEPTYTVRAMAGPAGDGRFRWRLEWYVDRKLRTAALGWLTRPDAQRAAQAQAATGASAPGRASRATVRTIQDLLELWIGAQEQRADLRPRSMVAYRLQAEHLAGHLGDVRLAVLTADDLARYRDARMREPSARTYGTGTVRQLCRGASPRTVFHELLLLSTAWKWGRGRDYVERALPEWRVRLAAQSIKPVPSEGDISAMLDALNGWPRLALLLCWATGARIGEIGNLRRRSVDLRRGVLAVDGKTGGREVPVAPEIVDELRRWMALMPGGPETWLLGVRPSVVSMCSSIHWRPVAEALDIPCPTGHGARRAVVDRMARAGVDPATGAAMMGHSPATQLQYYRQPTAEDLAAAVVSARLGSVAVEAPRPARRRSFRVARPTLRPTQGPETAPPKPDASR